MPFTEASQENCREKLSAVLTLMRLYAQEIVNHTTVILLSCEMMKDEQHKKTGPRTEVDQIAKAAKKIGGVSHKIATLESEYREYAM